MIDKILLFITYLFSKKYKTGFKEDTRTEEEKKKDYAHEERVTPTSIALNIWNNAKITESDYFYENQNYTSSCVPHGVILAYAILLKKVRGWYVRLSQMFVYRSRTNFLLEGMSVWEAFEYIRKNGSCLYESLPTPFSETEANKIVITQAQINEGIIFKGAEYYTFKETKNDINALAEESARGTAIPITVFATVAEWSMEYPAILSTYLTLNTAVVRHEVCILPNSGFIENGVKYVAIQDSSWFGNRKLRYLSEEFIRWRVYDARYWTTVSLAGGSGNKPKHLFTQYGIVFGSKSTEVTYLQKCLVYEGLLPEDCVTGYFAGRTLAAVRVFQEKYREDILIPNNLTEATGYVGMATIKKLNSIYAK